MYAISSETLQAATAGMITPADLARERLNDVILAAV